jgi:hypothetical protein
MDHTTLIQTAMILIFMWFCFLEINNGCNTSTGAVPSQMISLPKIQIKSWHILAFLICAAIGGGAVFLVQKYLNTKEGFDGSEMTPQMTPQMAPQMTPQMAPQMTPQMAPQMTLQMAPQMTPQMAPEITSQPESDKNAAYDEQYGANNGQSFYSYISPKEMKYLTRIDQRSRCIPTGKQCPPCPQFSQTKYSGWLTDKGWQQ